MTEAESWAAFVAGLRAAGEQLQSQIAEVDAHERADGYRALLRALNNHLGRFEVDRERPELVPFNGWREKFLMDNPDFRYWVADVRDDRRYRITGHIGDAIYQSITAYAGGRLNDTQSAARLDSDTMTIDPDGGFAVTLSRTAPASGDWLALPAGAKMVWVRQFHRDGTNERLGSCTIEPLDPPPAPEPIDTTRFAKQLERLGGTVAILPAIFSAAVATDREHPNKVRHWSEMVGGAAFTEPGIHYVRGSWLLRDDEALVIEGSPVPCRYWNIMTYSRFLNSLDYRARRVSRTSATATLVDGNYRFVLAARDPGTAGDWLDTEGRSFGLFVMRWLHAETPPGLPTLRVCKLSDLGAA